MALIKCHECENKISTRAEACIHCGVPIDDDIQDNGRRLDDSREQIIAEYTYSMLNANPLFLLIFILLSLTGAGVILLVGWHAIMLPRPKLIITDRSLIYHDNYFKVHTIAFYNIENIIIGCSPLQKLIHSGWLQVHQEGIFQFPLTVNGLPEPQKIKKLIAKLII